MAEVGTSGPVRAHDGTHESATPAWAWRSGVLPASSFPSRFLTRPAEEVAPDLLGQRIVSRLGGQRTEGVILEVEAYAGPHDPASHAAERIGRTARNEVMFGPPGRVYVYFIYGMHWCMNVVTGREGSPSAVLIRALEPLDGLEPMRRRRGREPLAAGPGRLCQALGVTGDLNGHDLSLPPLELCPGWRVDPDRVARSGRIGIRQARDWPLRFYLDGHPGVSG